MLLKLSNLKQVIGNCAPVFPYFGGGGFFPQLLPTQSPTQSKPWFDPMNLWSWMIPTVPTLSSSTTASTTTTASRSTSSTSTISGGATSSTSGPFPRPPDSLLFPFLDFMRTNRDTMCGIDPPCLSVYNYMISLAQTKP